MNIPEKVRIGGTNYEIREEDRLNDGSRLAYGHIDFDRALIRLDSNLQDQQGKCKTLLHEILHGIAKHFELAVGDDEDTIDKLAKGLYMVISDNSKMFGN
ncbi:MAG: hypothetical protein NC238_02970 [Dehalobacter sp.]|nr:hypothetical protein [Dehalobacter sp.]